MKIRVLGLTFMFVLLMSGIAIAEPGTSTTNTASQAFAISGTGSQFPMSPPMYPFLLQQVPGHVGDITKEMPNFDGLLPLTTEKVFRAKDSVQVQYGWFLDRVRLEDVEIDLLAFIEKVMDTKGWKIEEIRYRVQYKTNTRAVGTGVVGNAMGSSISSGAGQYAGAGGVGAMPGWASSLTDNHYIIKLYHVIPK